ncbi:hypothetical protein NP493_259g01027 [Ridgeia piscesae]|uniref:Major facilitator superfamily (MFS) profile domain-containing protein n=1 Tax=Ridgeia piscesae TaxID=27915 RepID=A0AAD9UCV8_RIDPI|nr:hypothetical protein NP493_259g01027 [Ridgeia piscesae]
MPQKDNDRLFGAKASVSHDAPLARDFSSSNQQQTDSITPPSDGSTVSLLQKDSFSYNALDQNASLPPDVSTVAPFSLWNSSRRQKLLLLALALVDLTSNMSLSVLAPFFPDEAAKKGVSDTTSGFIFGVFALVQFITSPIFGKLMPVVGARFLLLAGQFFGGGCVLLFGTLDYIPTSDENTTLFTVMCFVVRGFAATGCTASNTASFVITANAFPNNVATVFGILEMATGLGLMIGPAVGGVLFQISGFALPFVTLGAFMMLSVPVCGLCLQQQQFGDLHRLATVPLASLLRVPAVFIVCLAVTLGALVWSVIEPILQPHLVVFDLSPLYLGLIFLLMAAFYAVSSPVWGYVADKLADATLMLVFGFAFSGLGLLILGPSPLFGFDPLYNELWLNVLALVLLGVAVSLAVIPTFVKIISAAKMAGLADDMTLYASTAGLWGSMCALGDFLGPTIGGVLFDIVGFAWTVTYVAIACFVMALLLCILWVFERTCRTSSHNTKHSMPNGLDSNIKSTGFTSERQQDSETTSLLSAYLT